jgi:putative SOS response-associated peptidase YedK
MQSLFDDAKPRRDAPTFQVPARSRRQSADNAAMFPDALAPVIRIASNGERELTLMRWGFPPPSLGKVPVINVRNLSSPYWRGRLKVEWRRLAPAPSFCEWTDSRPKATNWLALDERRPLFAFAGIGPAIGKARRASAAYSRF